VIRNFVCTTQHFFFFGRDRVWRADLLLQSQYRILCRQTHTVIEAVFPQNIFNRWFWRITLKFQTIWRVNILVWFSLIKYTQRDIELCELTPSFHPIVHHKTSYLSIPSSAALLYVLVFFVWEVTEKLNGMYTMFCVGSKLVVKRNIPFIILGLHLHSHPDSQCDLGEMGPGIYLKSESYHVPLLWGGERWILSVSTFPHPHNQDTELTSRCGSKD
jgi:hypothetical protein